jgi:hypothetical protein
MLPSLDDGPAGDLLLTTRGTPKVGSGPSIGELVWSAAVGAGIALAFL